MDENNSSRLKNRLKILKSRVRGFGQDPKIVVDISFGVQSDDGSSNHILHRWDVFRIDTVIRIANRGLNRYRRIAS